MHTYRDGGDHYALEILGGGGGDDYTHKMHNEKPKMSGKERERKPSMLNGNMARKCAQPEGGLDRYILKELSPFRLKRRL